MEAADLVALFHYKDETPSIIGEIPVMPNTYIATAACFFFFFFVTDISYIHVYICKSKFWKERLRFYVIYARII